MIRTSLVCLLAGSLAGAWLLAGAGGGRMDLAEMHRELMLSGWVDQFALGTAAWILPRMRGAGSRQGGAAGWIGYGLLNGGVLLALVRSMSGIPASWPAAAMQATGMMVLVGELWRRIKPFGS
jgi:hypothetical protein